MGALEKSFEAAAAITRNAASSFPLAFRLLPRNQRRAMTVLYAWLRLTDDIGDEPDECDRKRHRLNQWRESIENVTFQHDIVPALHAVIAEFNIDQKHLHAVVDGVERDLDPRPFKDSKELEQYCHRVASAVGLLCLAVWGVTDEGAISPAMDAGVAFQLTNILRDLGEDRKRGRVYLPTDELHDCPPDSWADTPAFRRLMRMQIRRAEGYYQRAEALEAFLPPPALAMHRTMAGIYRALLDEIRRHPVAPLSRRLRVSRFKKLSIFLLVKW